MRPLALYFWGSRRWTLAAWCELRQAFRTFRPDRAETLDVLDERFEDDDATGLTGYLQQMEAEAAAMGFSGPGGFGG